MHLPDDIFDRIASDPDSAGECPGCGADLSKPPCAPSCPIDGIVDESDLKVWLDSLLWDDDPIRDEEYPYNDDNKGDLVVAVIIALLIVTMVYLGIHVTAAALI